jgi:hypothetical protein
VDVDDRSVPPNPQRANLVRDALRQQLAGLGACAPSYRVHGDLKMESSGNHVRVRLFLVVYAKDGALAVEIPTTVSGDRASADDVEGTDALLHAASEQAAKAFADHFH